MRCRRNLLFAAVIIGNLVSPYYFAGFGNLGFWMVLVPFFVSPPLFCMILCNPACDMITSRLPSEHTFWTCLMTHIHSRLFASKRCPKDSCSLLRLSFRHPSMEHWLHSPHNSWLLHMGHPPCSVVFEASDRCEGKGRIGQLLWVEGSNPFHLRTVEVAKKKQKDILIVPSFFGTAVSQVLSGCS